MKHEKFGRKYLKVLTTDGRIIIFVVNCDTLYGLDKKFEKYMSCEIFKIKLMKVLEQHQVLKIFNKHNKSIMYFLSQ